MRMLKKKSIEPPPYSPLTPRPLSKHNVLTPTIGEQIVMKQLRLDMTLPTIYMLYEDEAK